MKIKVSNKLDDLNRLVNEIKESSSEIGAVIIFIGVVRGVGRDGGKVLSLEYEAYEDVAEKALEKIIEDLKEKHGIIDAIIEHRVGLTNVGEDTVYALVASKHREEGFKSIIELIERLKHEVPIWKKEITDKGSQWIENP
ncbi:MAG: molybdenum cofactor biosynthesis protein MoaE [Candidatus Bathyarchaeota archaeon]|nr:molybdenum cofactor biosynthesis protein MoaE [Candidatus Bathyarchaeota archaeon]